MTEITEIIPLIEYDIEEGNHISWYHAKVMLEHINSLITTIEQKDIEIAHLINGTIPLLTTIESQKEEMLECIRRDQTERHELFLQIESLKAITEQKNAEIELLRNACESLFQLTQRGELTSSDLKQADDVYTDTLSEIERLSQ